MYGTAFKMLINAQLAQSMLVYAETALLGESLGFSRDFLMDTLPNLPVAAPFLAGKAAGHGRDDFAAIHAYLANQANDA